MVVQNIGSVQLLVLVWVLILAFCLFADEADAVQMKLTSDHLILKNGRESLAVSLSSTLVLDDSTVMIKAFSVDTKLDPASGRMLELPCATATMANGNKIEPTIILQWSPKESVLRKWIRLRLAGASPVLVKEVRLEDTTAPSPTPDSPIQPSDGARRVVQDSDLQSQPVFVDSFFAGVEFPIGFTRYVNNRITLAHNPGVRLKPGDTYESRKAVYGIAPSGGERLAFEKYIAANRPKSAGLHFNYNSWWTTPVPYSEADILKLLQTFKDKLVDPHGVSIDTFCIDLGWSRKDGLWEIDEKTFPKGFAGIQEAAKAMGSHLGLWISPSNYYSPSSMDNDWVAQQGYETFEAPGWDKKPMRYPCLAGVKYATKFAERLVDMGKRWEIKHFKFDGYRFTCPQGDHGHEPGELSAEAVAAGVISAYSALRKAVPDVWMQATCYGWDPSPWWLFYVNSVIGT
ncbi:MAG: alpha-galactosidase, partial [Armatimonadetes bacterium]|nr:alpha-galactosidase [Armatimonadota bacterium]